MFHFLLRHDSIIVDIISAPNCLNDHLNALFLIFRIVGYQQIALEVTLLCVDRRGCQEPHAQLVAYLVHEFVKVRDHFIVRDVMAERLILF